MTDQQAESGTRREKSFELVNCYECGLPFTEGQYVYRIKLDVESIVCSHGNPCCFKIAEKEVNRRPIKDWWIYQAGIIRDGRFAEQ